MNRLIITNDFEKCINEVYKDVLFLKDELKVEDVAEIKKEAYIAEKNKKIILIAAKKYNIYSQNALLKILEESPKNVEFILLTSSKYNMLDTILSRLSIEKKFFETKKIDIKIDTITNSLIFELLQKDLDKEEIVEILKTLTNKATNSSQLELINNALMMLELNIDKKAILSAVLLEFKEQN